MRVSASEAASYAGSAVSPGSALTLTDVGLIVGDDMQAAKTTLAARISIEQGMDEAEANAKLELVSAEVAKHLNLDE
jgi:hypothetical protein